MLTIYEKNNTFTVCDDKEYMYKYNIKSFFEKIIDGYIKDGMEIFMPLDVWGVAIINHLYKKGYKDATEAVTLDKERKLNDMEFSYIISANNGAMFSIHAKSGKKVARFLEIRNMIALDEEDIEQTFGSPVVLGAHRAIKEIRKEKTKGTTISSCAYNIWKKDFDRLDFDNVFPECDDEAESICRMAYHGGLCNIYGKENKVYKNGLILDVNSLYSYIMLNRRFATGKAHIVKKALPGVIRRSKYKTYYVNFYAVLNLKDGHIPFLRTRCDKLHTPFDIIETSEYTFLNGKKYNYTEKGRIKVHLCLYKAEFELMFEHYNVEEIEIVETVWFNTTAGIFDKYINKFYNKKKNAKTKGERRVAKMFLNALTGYLSFKKVRGNFVLNINNMKEISNAMNNIAKREEKNPFLCGEGEMLCMDNNDVEDLATLEGKFCKYSDHIVNYVSDRKSHIAIGAAITSEAMCYIIRMAQKNYDHFLYTDTDSLHLDCELKDVKGLKISDNIGDFKIEHTFDSIIYQAEKVYQYIEDGKFKMVCAGVPDKVKEEFESSCRYSIDKCVTSSILYDKKYVYDFNDYKTKEKTFCYTLDKIIT